MICFQGDQVGIAPRMFKALIGRGHPEFSTNRQQDAQEFFLHFVNMVEVSNVAPSLPRLPSFFFFLFLLAHSLPPSLSQRNCRSGPNPSEAFRFLVEERIVCQQSQKAKYTQRVDYIVQLPVPMDQATNTGERTTMWNGFSWETTTPCRTTDWSKKFLQYTYACWIKAPAAWFEILKKKKSLVFVLLLW